MNEVRTLARQTAVYGFGTIIPRFLNYGIMAIFYTRFFTKAEYGIITELYAWMAILLIFLTYGMETGFFRFAQKQEDYHKVYSTTLLSLFFTSLLFVIVVGIFIGPVSSLVGYSDHRDFVLMSAAIIAIDAFCAIPFARLRKENRPGIFSLIKVVNVIVIIASVLFLLLIAPGIWEKSNGWFRRIYNPEYRVGYVFAANLFGSIVTMILLLPYIIRIKAVFDPELWKRMLNYSFPLLIAGLSGSINDVLDKVIIRRVIGNETGLETVGEYGAGYKVAVLMALFIQMFRFAAEPFFFERAKHANAKESYAFVMKYFVIAMLFVFLCINLYLKGFQFIIGPLFRDSLIVVPVVSMGYLLYGIYVNHSIWYKLNDLTRYGIYITMAGAAMTVVINVFLIPVYGYMASAWAHVASYGLMIILSFIMASKHYRIEYNMGQLIPYFLLAIAIVALARTIKYENIATELLTNTALLGLFVIYAQNNEKILTILFKRK